MFQLLRLPAALCACIFATVSDARSIIPQHDESIAQQHRGAPDRQQPLFISDDTKADPRHRYDIPPPQHVNVMEHFDARENSVGVIFTTASGEDEAVHLWLPLGKRVFTRWSILDPVVREHC
ncbi:unnamed protein product [Cercospora beticola]|nr:unnamed protein product [Cercospora beticola]